MPKTITAVLVGMGGGCDKKELRKKGSDLDVATIYETLRYCENDEMDKFEYNDTSGDYYMDFRYIPNCNYIIMQNENATVEGVKAALRRAIQDELAIVYFSCKAKQIPATDASEADGLDECICLYDGNLVDNEIWEILKTAHGRVFVMFETSYAGSMLKATSKEDKASFSAAANAGLLDDLIREVEEENAKYADQIPNILCWAACMENETVDERTIGSKFTNAFYFKSDKWYTYGETFDRIQKSLENKQNI